MASPSESPAAKSPPTEPADENMVERFQSLEATLRLERESYGKQIADLLRTVQELQNKPDPEKVVPIDEANQVVQTREAALIEQARTELMKKDAEQAQFQLAYEAAKREAEQQSKRSDEITRQGHLMQTSLMEAEAHRMTMQTEYATQLGNLRAEYQAHLSSIQEHLQAAPAPSAAPLTTPAVAPVLSGPNLTFNPQAAAPSLPFQVPIPFPTAPSGNAAVVPPVSAQPIHPHMDAVLVALQEIAKTIEASRNRPGSSLAPKLSKFDSTRMKEEAASIWIDRVEQVGQDEGWFTRDIDLLGKLPPFMDDVAFAWIGSLAPESRSSLNWAGFKEKWRARFGMDFRAAWSALATRKQGDKEDCRSYGEGFRQLCAAAGANPEDMGQRVTLIRGFRMKVRTFLDTQLSSSTLPSFDEILRRASHLEKALVGVDESPFNLLAKGIKSHLPQLAQPTAGGWGNDIDPPEGTHEPHQGGFQGGMGRGHQGGRGQQWGGGQGGRGQGGRGQGGRGNGHQPGGNAPQNNGQPAQGGPGPQAAVPMDVGMVQHQGVAHAVHLAPKVPCTGTPEPTLAPAPNDIWSHLTVNIRGDLFVEALKDTHQGKLVEHLARKPALAGLLDKVVAQGRSSGPHAPSTVPLRPAPMVPSRPSSSDPLRPLPPAIGRQEPVVKLHPQVHKILSEIPSWNNGSYREVSLQDMAKEYNLVQCVAIHQETPFDCVLDSGSSLNLIRWKTVCEMGLAKDMLPSTLTFKVADGSPSQTMGRLNSVPLTFGNCHFNVTLAVIPIMEQPILLGTSFLEQCSGQLHFKKQGPCFVMKDQMGVTHQLPVSFHRRHPGIKELESDPRCWPGEADPLPEVAPTNLVLPHFSQVLATTPSGDDCADGPAPVEKEIEDSGKEVDGFWPPPRQQVDAHYVLSASQAEFLQQDKSDWQFLPRLFMGLNSEFGPYTVDACADLAGTNALVPLFWTEKDDCTKMFWGGHNAWCNPPFHMAQAVLDQFLEGKKSSPQNTSATFVVPAWVGSVWWKTLIDHFRIVRYYPPWSQVFTASPTKDTDARRLLGPTRWPVVVAVCDAGPLKGSPSWQPHPDDLDPFELAEMVEALSRQVPSADEADPLEQVRFGPDVTPDQKEEVWALLKTFGRKLWALSNYDLAEPINVIQHHIHVDNPAPIVRKGAPKSHAEHKLQVQWVQEMTECGIVTRSRSLNSSPIVMVGKRPEPGDTGPLELRTCVNFRARNDTTYPDDTTCPEVLPTLQALQGSCYFGSADGKAAFHQIEMAPESRGYTAFTIRGHGTFEFVRMPFGLKTAPATYIRAMDIIFEGSDRLHTFVDDVKHGAATWEDHVADIKDLCTRSLHHNLRLSPKKFLVGYRSLRALGYVVDKDGLHTDPHKVAAIVSISPPKDASTLRSFLGMTGYYQALIPGYSKLSGPLFELTAKNKNVQAAWTSEHSHCFEGLKAALANTPSLAYPDVNKRYTLTTDWQPGHMAAILSQPYDLPDGSSIDRPVHFIARKLSGYEAGWPATVGEQACVVWAVRKLHVYLFGVEFDIVTDHKALTSMLQCQDTTSKLARWSTDLYAYNFKVHHKAGKDLTNADGLSRTDKDLKEEEPSPSQISVPDDREVMKNPLTAERPPLVETPVSNTVASDSSQAAIPWATQAPWLEALLGSEWVEHLRMLSPLGISWDHALEIASLLTSEWENPEGEKTVASVAALEIPAACTTGPPRPPTHLWRTQTEFVDYTILPSPLMDAPTWSLLMDLFCYRDEAGVAWYPSEFFQVQLLPALLQAVYGDQWDIRLSLDPTSFFCDLSTCLKSVPNTDPTEETLYLSKSLAFWAQVLVESQPMGFQTPMPLVELLLTGIPLLNPTGSSSDPIVATLTAGPGQVMTPWDVTDPGPLSEDDDLSDAEWDAWEDSFRETLNEDFYNSDLNSGEERQVDLDSGSDESLGPFEPVFGESRSMDHQRSWYKAHQPTMSSDQLEQHLNHLDPTTCDRILYMTLEHEQALSASKDPWKNPVFLSYVRYRVLPFNIGRKAAAKIRSRAKRFRWWDSPKEGENLLFSCKPRGTGDSRSRIYPSPSRRVSVMEEAHAEAHQQNHSMCRRIGKAYFWFQMREGIRAFIGQCEVCQTDQTLVTADREMQPIPVGEKCTKWHIDLIGPLPIGEGGEKYVVVAIDSSTKWPEAGAIRSKTPNEVEQVIFREVVCRYPVTDLVTDNGTEFEGDFDTMCRDLGLKRQKTTPYHPQANGAVERFNQTLKRGLERLSRDHPHTWPNHLPRVLRAYRATQQSSSRVSPSEFMTGETLPLLGARTLAWTPYAQPDEGPSPIPQGVGWYGETIEKPFSPGPGLPTTLYVGRVTEIIITKEGEERLRVVYSDGDKELLEVEHVLPWWVNSTGRTWLERNSSVDPTNLTRVQHLVYTMNDCSRGHIWDLSQELVKLDLDLRRDVAFVPKRLPSEPFSPPSAEQAAGRLSLQRILDDFRALRQAAMSSISTSQAKQARAYSARKRPRNKRTEPLAIGGYCRVDEQSGGGRRSKPRWSSTTYRIKSLSSQGVVVYRSTDPNDERHLLRDKVLPIEAPADSPLDDNS